MLLRIGIHAQRVLDGEHPKRNHVEHGKVLREVHIDALDRFQHNRQHRSHDPENQEQLDRLVKPTTILTGEQQRVHFLAQGATTVELHELAPAFDEDLGDLEYPQHPQYPQHTGIECQQQANEERKYGQQIDDAQPARNIGQPW